MRPSVAWLCLILSLGGGSTGAAQDWARGQRWEVFADSGRVTVGDTVEVRFRLRLDERDLLFDTLPRPVDSLLEGVRIFSVDKLRRLPNRDFVGSLRLAFYRTGPQQVPVFSVPFMRAVKGITHGTVVSDTLSIEVTPVLPAGNPTLQDIREAEPSPVPRVLAGAALALVLVFAGLLLRKRRRGVSPIPVPIDAGGSAVAAGPPDPYQIASGRLEEIERERWPARGNVVRHYEAITDVLRDYLEGAVAVPARERTTTELRWALPPGLLAGELRDRYGEVFDEADLVKFARRRPGGDEAAAFLAAARALLDGWRSTAGAGEAAGAIR